ncbi:hypothetical protein [Polyangium sp. 15x6]|uniref:hypothetical protein n=1 Tax=Polyangium sp. 15x6 TaxID=3042687 RepID=UPI00249BCA51|nr:hypothetical protein [Polyangium sp. 15x6]MDI3290360.1 hypothetical protein [Polyangium sp. 15x6]
MMKTFVRRAWIILVGASMAPWVAGCDSKPSKQDECEVCVVDKDCKRGLSCELFERRGLKYRKCARANTKKC